MFETHQPNVDNMQQYLNQENTGKGEGPNWWSIPAGMSSVRILPPWDPTGRVALAVVMHPIEYKDDQMKYTKYNWTCVNKTFNKPCSICEGLKELMSAGVDISKWEASRRQYYFNAIVMHDPTHNGKDQGTAPGTHVLMKAPKTFYDWVVSQITNPMIGDITSIEKGIDVYITKEGQGLGTSYSMTLSPNGRTAIPQQYLDKIQNLYNIDDVFSVGFEQDLVDKLVASLKKSAGVMSSAIPNVVNTMAGYTQAPQYQPATPYTSTMTPPVPNYQSQVPTGIPMTPNPYASQPVNPPLPVTSRPPWQPQAPSSSPASSTSGASSNLPKCFGQYDAGSVNCVVCPHEADCARSK